MRATYGTIFSEEQMTPWITGGETEAYVDRMLGDMQVAEANGAVVGVIALEGDLIDLLWVGLAARGQGVGRRLMTAGEAALSKAGHETGRLEVFAANDRAIAFYEQNGWVRAERYPDPVAGVDKLLLTKRLAR